MIVSRTALWIVIQAWLIGDYAVELASLGAD